MHFTQLGGDGLIPGGEPAQSLPGLDFEYLDHFHHAVVADHVAQRVEFNRVECRSIVRAWQNALRNRILCRRRPVDHVREFPSSMLNRGYPRQTLRNC